MKRLMLLTAMALASSTAAAQPTTENGGLLSDANGRTVYTFEYDRPGKSNCNFACTVLWFPYRASTSEQGDGRFSILERADGIRQWAIDGRPLYLYAGDVRPPDANGDMPGWPWHVVRLDGKTDESPDSASE